MSKWQKDSKYTNVLPINKKDYKQTLKNYKLTALLPIGAKVFERIIYNISFEYLIENNLITDNQCSFKPGDSCINQLLSITHDIYKSFNDGFEVKGMFRNITKSFKYNKGFFRFKKTENGIKRAIFILGKYYSRGTPRFKFRTFVLSYLN